MIPLFKVHISEDVITYVNEVLRSGYIGQGSKVDQFEIELRKLLQNSYVLTTNSCTSAIHLAHRLIGTSLGDEILSTPMTCVATNWPIVHAGATIRWCDINPLTLNISPDSIREQITSRTKAIQVVHWGGNPCDLEVIYQISDEYNIPVIEDCAHAIGATYKGRPIGSFGTYCVYSFQAIKHVTTGDGGCLVTPQNQYSRGKLLRWYGIDREIKSLDDRVGLDIPQAGDKFHMNDIAAAMGIAQLCHLNSILARHRDNAAFYLEELKGLPGLQLPVANPESSWWLFTLQVDERENFMIHMRDCGIQVSQVHERNDIYSSVARFQTNLPNVDLVEKKMVCIPVGWWLSDEDREYIVECIKKGW